MIQMYCNNCDQFYIVIVSDLIQIYVLQLLRLVLHLSDLSQMIQMYCNNCDQFYHIIVSDLIQII